VELEDSSRWELSDEMANYLSKNMNAFILGKQLIDFYPLPKNVVFQKELDGYMKEILTDKGQKQCLSLDRAFACIQDKVANGFGPLTLIWDFMEKERNTDLDEAGRTLRKWKKKTTKIINELIEYEKGVVVDENEISFYRPPSRRYFHRPCAHEGKCMRF